MNIKQTKTFALSLAVATPTLMQSVPVTATTAAAELTPVSSHELVYNPHMDDGRTELLGALVDMSADEKQSIGGDRIVLAGNYATTNSSACATGGIWCKGGQWSNGCTCAITRRIVVKPK